MLVHDMIKVGKDEKTAIIYKDKEISYKNLRENVNIFRNYLYEKGVKKGDKVGLFYKNSAEFIYGYIAIASLGGVVVPFNIMLKPRELEYMANDSAMKLVVTMQKLEIDIEQVIVPEVYELMCNDYKDRNAPVIDVAEDDECVIIYTSGTTGNPKGAVLTHRNLSANCESVREVINLREDERSLAVLPMFHSFAWTTMVLVELYVGATVCIMEMFVPGDALRNIAENKLTFVCGVPAMYNFYLAAGSKEMFSTVRYFVCGGAPLPVEVLNKFESKFGIRIMEGYGLSEASPVVCFNPIGKGKPGSVGLPIPRVEVKIVNDKGEELPVSEIGEIVVRGENVMKGYLNMPEVTEKTIVDGWLHTGDLGFKDNDGYVYIVDRLKDMIIVSGLNVYSKEIEEEIYKHPDVVEAAVIGVPDEKRGEAVCAFVVLQEGKELVRKEFLGFLKERLASYKIPRHVYQVDVLPKNSTGKIAKNELRNKFTN